MCYSGPATILNSNTGLTWAVVHRVGHSRGSSYCRRLVVCPKATLGGVVGDRERAEEGSSPSSGVLGAENLLTSVLGGTTMTLATMSFELVFLVGDV